MSWNTKSESNFSAIFGRADFFELCVNGNIEGYEVLNIQGRNKAVGTTFEPVALAAHLEYPPSAVDLEVLSSDAGDGVGGDGAREIKLILLDANFEVQEVRVTMNGLTPVSVSGGQYIRLLDSEVSIPGLYTGIQGGVITPSNLGTITIRIPGPGAVFGVIGVEATIGVGALEMAAYTVPKGKSVFIMGRSASSDVAADLAWFYRPGANINASPFTPMTLFHQENNFSGEYNKVYLTPQNKKGPLTEYTDIFVLAKAAAAAAVTAGFTLLVVDNSRL